MHASGNNTNQTDGEFAVIFKKDALEKLKELALFLGISEAELGNVLIKGLHLIDMAKEGKIFIERKNDCFEVDIKKL